MTHYAVTTAWRHNSNDLNISQADSTLSVSPAVTLVPQRCWFVCKLRTYISCAVFICVRVQELLFCYVISTRNRWINSSRNGVDPEDKDQLLAMFRRISHADTADSYAKAVDLLQRSSPWKSNTALQNWFTRRWLSHSKASSQHCLLLTF